MWNYYARSLIADICTSQRLGRYNVWSTFSYGILNNIQTQYWSNGRFLFPKKYIFDGQIFFILVLKENKMNNLIGTNKPSISPGFLKIRPLCVLRKYLPFIFSLLKYHMYGAIRVEIHQASQVLHVEFSTCMQDKSFVDIYTLHAIGLRTCTSNSPRLCHINSTH